MIPWGLQLLGLGVERHWMSGGALWVLPLGSAPAPAAAAGAAGAAAAAVAAGAAALLAVQVAGTKPRQSP